ncbi:MAG: Methionyl-tRNA synthetase [Ktedonobacterales bacterium]|jgi:methionyl-tRNA synthetase|nr:MAG: Methionyl-tRNA synthetase [Ktedonobacterales bacterium]
MAKKKTNDQRPPWYVTTAIPYVNARPHIGFALEIILTDALARYHRLRGEDVWFLTGTDDNSLKNARAAEKEGIPTSELVNRNAAFFQGLRGTLNLTNDDFIRTSVDERHLTGVAKLWEACAKNGDIYTQPYRGLYCVGCEQFYTEDELIDGLCPEHLTKPEVVEEENYFFRLSRYGAQLEELITSGQLRIIPDTRRNEVLSFIRSGLQDFSISRSRARARDWGIPVPGDPKQVMYVWFDALSNYITALDYTNEGELYQHYWQHNPNRTHVVGKGIIRFHTIYWPAMLLSAGVPLPTTVFVHGYVLVGGGKMSKTLGNVIDPVDLAERYGADALRYFLLRAIPSTEDGDFTLERFIQTCNADLADRLGNLLNRTVSMVGRYFGGAVPAPGLVEEADGALIATANGLAARVDAAMQRFAPHEALAAIWELVDAANKYVEDNAPWSLAKQRKAEPEGPAAARLATVLYHLIEALRLASVYCAPFIPVAAEEIGRQIGIPLDTGADWYTATTWGGAQPGTRVAPGSVLFTKHELPEAAPESEEAQPAV